MTFLKCRICGQRTRIKPSVRVYQCKNCGTKQEISFAASKCTGETRAKHTVVVRSAQMQNDLPQLNDKPSRKGKRIILFAGITVCVVVALVVLWLFFVTPFQQYHKARELMEKGLFENASIVFAELGDFMDSPQKVQECETAIRDNEYNLATKLLNEGKYLEAIDIYTKLDGYKDSALKIVECNTAICETQYNEAMNLKNEGKLDEAYILFRQIGEYKDVSDLAGEIRLVKTIEELKNADIGDCVPFGVYEQDGNESNGTEDIEWRILAKEGNRVLLLSEYALHKQVYWENNQIGTKTFANSSVREWLNDDFYNSAFSTKEQDKIVRTTISSGKYTEFSDGLISDLDLDGLPDLVEKEDIRYDKLFLLSAEEVQKYFDSSVDRQCQLTPYAQGEGNSDGYCRWWLRGNFSSQYVAKNGTIPDGNETDEAGDRVYVATASIAVRPALWIELD